MVTLLGRITFNPKQCGGRPCIRGMRIRVSDILDLFAAGLDAAQILDEMPDLEAEDLKACLNYAARGRREKFDRVLSKVPDVEPEEHDRLSPHNAA